MNDSKFEAARIEYSAAFDAYREIANNNARLALSGGRPTAEQLAEEKRAQAALETARRAYLAAMSLSPSDD